MWLCRARAGSLAADPDVCPPGQHAVPDEHAPLMSTTVSDEDDATEVGLHLALLMAATNNNGDINNHNRMHSHDYHDDHDDHTNNNNNKTKDNKQ